MTKERECMWNHDINTANFDCQGSWCVSFYQFLKWGDGDPRQHTILRWNSSPATMSQLNIASDTKYVRWAEGIQTCSMIVDDSRGS